MRLRDAIAVGCALSLAGCGGGVPLLYPARALATGDVRVTAGTSGTFAVGSLGSAVDAAQREAGDGVGLARLPGRDPTYAQGALVLAAVAPGLAPYVAARVGAGDRFEGGVAYTGHAAHLDVRRSFDWRDVSLSVGLGVETPIYGNPDTSVLPQVDLGAVHGYGADVPVVVGWQSAARVYMVWGGVRAGWDHTDVGSASSEPNPPPGGPQVNLSADRYYGGGVVGLAAGFRHVHAALELDVAYESVSGSFNGTNVTVSGLSMAPAGAIWITF